jgi:hypothetical protein
MNDLSKHNIRLFETQKGCAGYCLGKVESGDLLYLVSGLNYPLLMRPVRHMSRLVTTAFFADLEGQLPWSWTEQLHKLQEEAQKTSAGDIPHPNDEPLYKSDPGHLLEQLLPDLLIC